jgi:hypothetical protein
MTKNYDASNSPQFQRSRPVPPSSPAKISPLRLSKPSAKPSNSPVLPNPSAGSDVDAGVQSLTTEPLGAVSLQEPPTDVLPLPPRPPRHPFWLKIPRNWQFWGVASVVAFGGVGLLSAAILLKLPALPNCPNVFWPTASASLRLYCAQLAAEKNSVDDLLYAIELVNALPKDHPLRPEVDRSIEQWAREILELTEATFQKGELKQAIEGAKKIPTNTAAAKLVDESIQRWEKIWKKAEGIYKDAEDALGKRDLREAFLIATRLLSIDNKYWETAKYKELTDIISATREDIEKLNKAQDLQDQGGLKSLVEAVNLLEEIKQNSRVYNESLKMLKAVGNDMLALANAAMDRRNYDEATDIASQIPEKAGLQEEVKDFELIASAQSRAWGGTVVDLQGAIAEAQKLQRGRPLYGRAQELISSWQLEIQDVMHLDKAREYAQRGDAASLQMAIAEAQAIPNGNPRYKEAQGEIGNWLGTIQTAEDRPLLDRAQSLASRGDAAGLQAAIEQANQVGSGRALSGEADQLVRNWSGQLQEIEDRPRLDRARSLANQGDLQAAINVAGQISSGSSVYSEAQADMAFWRSRIEEARRPAPQPQFVPNVSSNAVSQPFTSAPSGNDGQAVMEQARSAAGGGTTADLLNAIQFAAQVPAESSLRVEADTMINRWSWQIQQTAEALAATDPESAISVAQSVPPNTEAYGTAQARIQEWRQRIRR